MMQTVSVVVPVYNEETNLEEFSRRLSAVGQELQQSGYQIELVFVDDHSCDNSPRLAREILARYPKSQYVRFSRNFGSFTALAAGLALCTGDCAVMLAADLQDPPELLPELLAKRSEGFDVVWATRAGREGESFSTLLFARIYYWVMRTIALPEMPATGADFFLLDRKVIDAYNRVSESNTSMIAMLIWMGFRQTRIEYVKEARHSGASKWTFRKKLKLFVDSTVSFSYVPIRMMSLLGACVSCLGFVYACVILFLYTMTGRDVPGWASLMVVVLVLGGFQLLMLGVLGEYLWRAYDEARGRPRFIVEEHERK